MTVDLSIAGLGGGTSPSLGVYDIGVVFDSSLLSFASVSWGNGLDPYGLGDSRTLSAGVPGSVDLYELSLDSAADLDTLQPASFLLASLSFTAIGTGVSGISVSINALGDAEGARLPASVDYGRATPMPEPAGWTLLLAGAAMLAWSRRHGQEGLAAGGPVLSGGGVRNEGPTWAAKPPEGCAGSVPFRRLQAEGSAGITMPSMPGQHPGA